MEVQNKTHQQSMSQHLQDCMKLLSDFQQILECPVCYNVNTDLGQCRAGHHICYSCMENMRNSCPICQSDYTGTKLFIAKDINESLCGLKDILNSLKEINSKDTIDKYREIIKSLLKTFSFVLNQVHRTLKSLNIYLNNDKEEAHLVDLEKNLDSLNTKMNSIEHEMNEVSISFKNV